uniref:Cytochrome n=1 Tax=Lutzomyia longipalpis TaxID=7200 RepID=A0A1B0GHJ9_LUTLO
MMRNPEWKEMRSKLSPVFTSGKMRHFFNLMMDAAADLDKFLAREAEKSPTNSFVTEMKEFCALFTTDVIASCAYGIEAHSMTDPNSAFRSNGRKVFDFNLRRATEVNSFFFLPELVPFFRFKLFSNETTNFLRSTMNHVMEEREKSGYTRNDLIDILIGLKNAKRDKEDRIKFEGDVLVAQAGVFFTAGFETSSATMSFALYELAKQ